MFGMYFGKVVIVVGLFYEVYSFGDGGKQTFRCSNGQLIAPNNFCDGYGDCADRGDEGFGCAWYTCREGKFSCANKECVPISKRCNTVVDCPDGSDEWNCDHEHRVSNCTIEEEKFLCKDGLRCLHLIETCDGYKNCFDDSDEGDNCKQYDADICTRCPHVCILTADGPRCLSDFSNNTFHSSYRNVGECNEFENRCDQKCFKLGEMVRCSCDEHYELRFATSCKSVVPYGNLMMYSTTTDIKKWNFTSKKLDVIQDNVIATALTGADDYAYWSVMSNNRASVFRKRIYDEAISVLDVTVPPSSHNAEKLINEDLNITSPVTGIAVDRITNNLYFTSLKWLSVCSIYGRLCVNLKSSVHSIESVTLAPKYGVMFWIEYAEKKISFKSRIFKSAMDGSNEGIFVDSKLSSYYRLLIADEHSEKLYALNKRSSSVEAFQFNGMGHKTIRHENGIYSFAEMDGSLYWISSFNNMTITSDIDNLPKNEKASLTHLYAYNPLEQWTKVLNPCSSTPCKGLCLSRPWASLTKKLNYTCICENFQLANKFRGRQWCNSFGNHTSKNKEEKSHVSTISSHHITAPKESTTMGVPKRGSEKASEHLQSTISSRHIIALKESTPLGNSFGDTSSKNEEKEQYISTKSLHPVTTSKASATIKIPVNGSEEARQTTSKNEEEERYILTEPLHPVTTSKASTTIKIPVNGSEEARQTTSKSEELHPVTTSKASTTIRIPVDGSEEARQTSSKNEEKERYIISTKPLHPVSTSKASTTIRILMDRGNEEARQNLNTIYASNASNSVLGPFLWFFFIGMFFFIGLLVGGFYFLLKKLKENEMSDDLRMTLTRKADVEEEQLK